MLFTADLKQDHIRDVALRLNREADGKKLRRRMIRNMRLAVEPIRQDVREAVKAIPTQGPSGSPPLLDAIASNIKIEVRLAGKTTGVRLRIPKRPMPRGFANAPQRLDSRKGWRHPVYGGKTWVAQTGRPYWSVTILKHAPEVREAVLRAVEETARAIAKG